MTAAKQVRRVGALALVLAVAGCGGGEKVGQGISADGLGGGGGTRLGETTTTVAPAAAVTTPTTVPATPKATVAPVTTKPKAVATTVAVATTATTKAAAPAIVVKIGPDGASQFDPRISTVSVGSVVTFTNTDTTARSVVADGGAFSSGPIAPGASYRYKATKAGSINFHDGTRPYAVGTLEVG